MSFNLFLMVFGWASLGLSFEPWEGEVTKNLKLREAPGLDQQVLTVIKRGDKVKVLDQKEDWYLVSIKEKITPVSPETKEVLPLSEARKETEPQAGAAKEITQTPQTIGDEEKAKALRIKKTRGYREPWF